MNSFYLYAYSGDALRRRQTDYLFSVPTATLLLIRLSNACQPCASWAKKRYEMGLLPIGRNNI